MRNNIHSILHLAHARPFDNVTRPPSLGSMFSVSVKSAALARNIFDVAASLPFSYKEIELLHLRRLGGGRGLLRRLGFRWYGKRQKN